MKSLILLSVLLISGSVLGQKLTEADLVGSWKTQQLLKKPDNPHYRDIIDSFKASTFTFGADHVFDLKTDENSNPFATIRNLTKKKNWKFDEQNQIIKIGNAADSYSTWKIKIRRTGEKVIFVLEDQNMELEVKKNETKKPER